MAVDLALRGFRIRLYEESEFIGRLAHLAQTLRSTAGVIQGTAQIEMLTDDLQEAIEGVQYIIVVAPSFAHQMIASRLKGIVKTSQRILIYPGGFGALQFKRILGDECPPIVQANNLPYDTRIVGDATVFCSGRNPISIALFPASIDRGILADVAELRPYDTVYQDVLECDLSLVNPSIHPGPCLINIGAIEQQHLREHSACTSTSHSVPPRLTSPSTTSRSRGAAYGYTICALEDSYNRNLR